MNKATIFATTILLTSIAAPAISQAQTPAMVAVPPAEVRTYVLKESVPSVRVEEQVVVGSELPGTVVLHPVPKFERYSYAVVNDQRVIVDANTRKIIQVIE